MVGRGAAAAAHNLRAGGDGLARKAGHVFRRAEIDVAALNGARHAGVGHGGQRQCSGGAHGLNGGEHGGWAGGAVDADGACAPLGEQRRGLGRRGAVEAVAFVVDRDHHQHGQVRCDLLRGGQRLLGLIERGHGLNDEQVGARFFQGENLLGKSGSGFVQAGFAQRLKAHAKRANGAADPGFAGLLVFQVLYGLAREPHTGGVDLRHLGGKSVPRQAEAVGAEGVGFKHLGAGLQVFLVDGENQGRDRRGSARRSSG